MAERVEKYSLGLLIKKALHETDTAISSLST